MIPCVVLASSPKKTIKQSDIDNFRKEWADFVPGQTLRTTHYNITLSKHDQQDGGNGGGGEPGGVKPMHPAVSSYGATFWDFAEHPASADRSVKFPPALQFQVCVPFNDVHYAATFLKQHVAGKRLCAMFDYVQIVAVSTPFFVGSIGAFQNETGAFGVAAPWIGT